MTAIQRPNTITELHWMNAGVPMKAIVETQGGHNRAWDDIPEIQSIKVFDGKEQEIPATIQDIKLCEKRIHDLWVFEMEGRD